MAKANIQIATDMQAVNDFVVNSWRPEQWSEDGRPYDRHGNPLVVNERALQTNSFLAREEWEALDRVVYEMGQRQLGAYQDLIGHGLTRRSSIATMSSKWRVASERIAADVTMDFRSRLTYDRTDKKMYGVPLPLISAPYSIGRRELAATRAAGQDVETFEAEEATRAVTEKAEDILINGNTSIVVDGNSIPGYTTLTSRDTDTAANYGGGDFGTEGNGRKTVLGLMEALAAKQYYGPFGIYLNNVQYHELLNRYTDGSGDTELSAIETIPEIEFVKPNALVAAANCIMVQFSRSVVDLEIAMTLENRRWESPDGAEMFFLVMMAVAPRLKTDYDGNAGIAHATAC